MTTQFAAIDPRARQRHDAALETRLRTVLNTIWARYGNHARALPTARRDAIRRTDSQLQRERRDSGLFLARDLEHVYQEVLREEFPVPNALRLFHTDTSVAPGARTHTVRRLYGHGEVSVHRAGQDIPRVGLSQREEQFPVRHYVTSFGVDIFEQASADFANFAAAAELLREARDIMLQFLSDMTWHGYETHGIFGVLNYPWLFKRLLGAAVGPGSSLTPDQTLNLLHAIVNYPSEVSSTTFKPDTLVTSERVHNYLFNTPRTSTSDTTIGEYFLRTSKHIKTIEVAWELQAAGPGATDGILAYRRDRLGISNVIPQGFTTLPMQQLGFDQTTYAYMSHGGVIMRNVANNILGWTSYAD